MMKFHSFFVLFAVMVIFSSAIAPAFAAHGAGGSGGSGCSGDCSPPTLGQDNSGRTYVNGGFAINGQAYDVAYFKQDIPTETVKINEPVIVTLKIFENSGSSSLTHVILKLGLEEKIISGVKVPTSPVEILWENPFDSTPSVSIQDPGNLVSDVTVETAMTEDAFGTIDNVTVYDFKFTPVEKFDTDVILVTMWDYKNNVWSNHFHNALLIEDDNNTLGEEIPLDTQSEENFEDSQQDPLGDDASKTELLPTWIKTTAQFWSKNQIDDTTFTMGLQFLIDEKIIKLSDDLYSSANTQDSVSAIEPVIPSWIKFNASLWAENQITDSDFLNGIEFLVNERIILI